MAPIDEAQGAFWEEMAAAGITGFPSEQTHEEQLRWLEDKMSLMTCSGSMEPKVRVELVDVPPEEEALEEAAPAPARRGRRGSGRSRR